MSQPCAPGPLQRGRASLHKWNTLEQTSALDRTGVTELWAALVKHRETLEKTGGLAVRRRAGAIAWGARAFARRHGEVGIERVGGEAALAAVIAARLDAGEEIPVIIETL